jgi:serine/threonine protein kinase
LQWSLLATEISKSICQPLGTLSRLRKSRMLYHSCSKAFSTCMKTDLPIETFNPRYELSNQDSRFMLITRQNIMVKSKPPEFGKWWVKIGDFGISKRAGDTNGPLTILGTVGYMAPELLTVTTNPTGRTGEESLRAQPTDIWGLGEIAFRMIAARPSFNDLSTLLRWVQSPSHKFLDPLKPLVPDVVIDFIQGLLKANPGKRLSAKQALEHPWIKTTLEIETSDLPSTAEQSWPQDPRSIYSDDASPSAKWSTLSQSANPMANMSTKTTMRQRVSPERSSTSARINDANSTVKKAANTEQLSVTKSRGEKGMVSSSMSSILHSALDADQPTVRASPTSRSSTPTASSNHDRHSPDPLEDHESHNHSHTRSSIDSEDLDIFLDRFALYQPGNNGYVLGPLEHGYFTRKNVRGSMELVQLKFCPTCRTHWAAPWTETNLTWYDVSSKHKVSPAYILIFSAPYVIAVALKTATLKVV